MYEKLVKTRDDMGLKDYVNFRGSLPYHSVTDYYLNADFNIMASKTEGYPKVLLEGMVYGAVPIASKVGIIDSILGQGRHGLCYSYGNIDQLVDQILNLINNPSLNSKMIISGREYSRTVTIEAFQEKIIDIIDQHWNVSLQSLK
jgi:glycosyltransferase involved in cell wall biosynthesis